jgi:hypothetical protein
MVKPLIADISSDEVDESLIPDAWLVVAWNIEQSLISAGATPGTDYTWIDLYQMAQPFVIEKWEKGDVEFITGMTVTADKHH